MFPPGLLNCLPNNFRYLSTHIFLSEHTFLEQPLKPAGKPGPTKYAKEIPEASWSLFSWPRVTYPPANDILPCLQAVPALKVLFLPHGAAGPMPKYLPTRGFKRI